MAMSHVWSSPDGRDFIVAAKGAIPNMAQRGASRISASATYSSTEFLLHCGVHSLKTNGKPVRRRTES